MSASHSLRTDKVLYGGLFVVVLPAALALWAVALDARLTLPRIGGAVPGSAIAAFGLGMMLTAVVVLRVRGGGWPMSPFPPERLVENGPYRLLAHPLYAGSVLLCAGVSLLLGSPSGLWIVSPVLAAACVAFVAGFENEQMVTRRAILHVPSGTDERPAASDRLSMYAIVLLPWLIAYEAVNRLGVARDAIAVVSPWDALVPVVPWTEMIYFAAYPLVLFAPLVARTSHDLRRFAIRAWVATGSAMLMYVVIPTLPPQKPAPAGSIFAAMLEWERAWDAPATALPAFHVIWVMLTADLYARAFPRLRALRWPVILAVGASCVTTGMHALIDVVAGLILGALFVRVETIWALALRWTERLSNSWSERRIGFVRLINHGMYPAIGSALGIAMITALAGGQHRLQVFIIGMAAIVGAAAWAQWIEGSTVLLRPYGYYGGIAGGVLAIAVIGAVQHNGLLLLAAYAVGAPFIQAIGRIRCLVQGCCHGRPAVAGGVRVWRPESRVVRVAHLGGVSLHPTALYSTLANLVIGIALVRLWVAGAPLAFIAGSYFILSGLERFVEEHFRGEPQTKVVAGLRLYQWISIASIIAGAVLTALPSARTAPIEPISVTTIALAAAFGIIAYVAYGADFPESNRRFSRLA